MLYLIINIFLDNKGMPVDYLEYIENVKSIVEEHGGKYIARTNEVTSLSNGNKPDRVIIIEFENLDLINECFSSSRYQEIKGKRENSVRSESYIVRGIL